MANYLDETLKAYDAKDLYYFDEQIILTWYAKKVVEKFGSDISVLDLGLGHGITANIFSDHFKDYTILDGSPEIIKSYKEQNPDSNAQIIETYFEDYKTDKKYDLIIMGFILEHVGNPVQIMSYYKQFLKTNTELGGGGGQMVLAVPNAEAMNRRLGYYAGLLDDMTALSEQDNNLGHVRYYTVDTFKEDIKKSGLNVGKVEGLYLKPFTTKQIISLNFDQKILDAMCILGEQYPELSLSIMAEATA